MLNPIEKTTLLYKFTQCTPAIFDLIEALARNTGSEHNKEVIREKREALALAMGFKNWPSLASAICTITNGGKHSN